MSNAFARRITTRSVDPAKKKLDKFFDEKSKPQKRFSSAAKYLDSCSTVDGGRFCRDNYSRLWQTVLDAVQAHDTAYKTLKDRGSPKACKEVIALLAVIQKMLMYLPDLIQKRWQLRSITAVLERALFVQNRPEIRKAALHCLLQLLEDLHELNSTSIGFHLELLVAALDLHAFRAPNTSAASANLAVAPLYATVGASIFVPLQSEKTERQMFDGALWRPEQIETFSTFGGAQAVGDAASIAAPPPLPAGSRERIRYSLHLMEELFVFVESLSQERFSVWWRYVVRDRLMTVLFPRAILAPADPIEQPSSATIMTSDSAPSTPDFSADSDLSGTVDITNERPTTPSEATILPRVAKQYVAQADRGFGSGCPPLIIPIIVRKLSSWWRQWFGRSSQVLWSDAQSSLLLQELFTQAVDLPASVSITHVSAVAHDFNVKTLRSARTEQRAEQRTAADDTIALLSGPSKTDGEYEGDPHVLASIGEHASASASGNVMSHTPQVMFEFGTKSGRHSALIESLHAFVGQVFGDGVANRVIKRSGISHDVNYLSLSLPPEAAISPAASALASSGMHSSETPTPLLTLDALQKFLVELLPRIFCCGQKDEPSYVDELLGKVTQDDKAGSGQGTDAAGPMGTDSAMSHDQRIAACHYALRLCIIVASHDSAKAQAMRQKQPDDPSDFAPTPVQQQILDVLLDLLLHVLNGRPLLPPKAEIPSGIATDTGLREKDSIRNDDGPAAFLHPSPPAKPLSVPSWLATVLASDLCTAVLTVWMICNPPRSSVTESNKGDSSTSADSGSSSAASVDNWQRLRRAWSQIMRRKDPTQQLAIMLKNVVRDMTRACTGRPREVDKARMIFDNLLFLFEDSNTIVLYLPSSAQPPSAAPVTEPGELHAAAVSCIAEVVMMLLSHSRRDGLETDPANEVVKPEWDCSSCQRCGVVNVVRKLVPWLLETCQLARRKGGEIDIPGKPGVSTRSVLFERGIATAYSCMSHVILEELRLRGGRHVHHASGSNSSSSYFSYIPHLLLERYYTATCALLTGASLSEFEALASTSPAFPVQQSRICRYAVFRHATAIFSYAMPGVTSLAAIFGDACRVALLPAQNTKGSIELTPIDVRSAAVKILCSLFGYASVLRWPVEGASQHRAPVTAARVLHSSGSTVSVQPEHREIISSLFENLYWDLIDTLVASLQHYIVSHPIASTVDKAARAAHDRSPTEYRSGFDENFTRTGHKPKFASYGRIDVGENLSGAIGKALDASHYAANEAAVNTGSGDLSEHHVARMCVNGIVSWLIVNESCGNPNSDSLAPPGTDSSVIETALATLLRCVACFAIHPIWYTVSLAALSGISHLAHANYANSQSNSRQASCDGTYDRNAGVMIRGVVCVTQAVVMHMHSQAARPTHSTDGTAGSPFECRFGDATPTEVIAQVGLTCARDWALLSPARGVESSYTALIYAEFFQLCMRSIWYHRTQPSEPGKELVASMPLSRPSSKRDIFSNAPVADATNQTTWAARKQTSGAPSPKSAVLAGARHRANTQFLAANSGNNLEENSAPQDSSPHQQRRPRARSNPEVVADGTVTPFSVQRPYQYCGEELVALTAYSSMTQVLHMCRDRVIAGEISSIDDADESNADQHSIRVSVGPANVGSVATQAEADAQDFTTVAVTSRDGVSRFTWSWSLLTAEHDSNDLLLLKMLEYSKGDLPQVKSLRRFLEKPNETKDALAECLLSLRDHYDPALNLDEDALTYTPEAVEAVFAGATAGTTPGDGGRSVGTWIEHMHEQVVSDETRGAVDVAEASARREDIQDATHRLTRRLANTMSSAELRKQLQQLMDQSAEPMSETTASGSFLLDEIAALVGKDTTNESGSIARSSSNFVSSNALARVWFASSSFLRFLVFGSGSHFGSEMVHPSVVDQHAVELCGAVSAGGVYANKSETKNTQQDAAESRLLRRLRGLDKENSRDAMKIAVVYVAKGQHTQASILGNEVPAIPGRATSVNSLSREIYKRFVRSLGWPVELSTHSGFLGGLERNDVSSNGGAAWYFASPVAEMIFHVVTEFPTLKSDPGTAAETKTSPPAAPAGEVDGQSIRKPGNGAPQHVNKKRHVGNDSVHVIYSENHGACVCCGDTMTGTAIGRCGDYDPVTIKSQFNDAHIVLYPLAGPYAYTLARVQVFQKAQLNQGLDAPSSPLHRTISTPLFGPLLDGMVIPLLPVARKGDSRTHSGTVAALLACLTATQAYVDVKIADTRQQYDPNHARRIRAMRSFVDSADPVNMVSKEGIGVAGATSAATGGRHRTTTNATSTDSSLEAAERSAVLRTLLQG